MTVQGVGTDIIEIERVAQAIQRHGDRFLRRLFTPKEIAYCQSFTQPAPHFAARFAAKEAIFKALNDAQQRTISWQQVEIINDASGRPVGHFAPPFRAQFPTLTLHLSLSHCRAYATATALITQG